MTATKQDIQTSGDTNEASTMGINRRMEESDVYALQLLLVLLLLMWDHVYMQHATRVACNDQHWLLEGLRVEVLLTP